MKSKFIRTLSPILFSVIAILDIAVLCYGVFAVKKLTEMRTGPTIFFAAIEVVAIIVAVLVTKEIFGNGVVFRDDEFEFTGLDENNLFDYDQIIGIETKKDDKASLVKNFVDRQSMIILTLKDEKVVTVNIGLTTKNTLEKIEKELRKRTNISAKSTKTIDEIINGSKNS